MAEQVNQRVQDMIQELEQMRRTDLYNEDEIREIARKRKEFEYKVQRRVKSKEDFVHYIAYELALMEDISLRRRQAKLTEKKKDIEYAIAKRLNKIFKQFISRFQNDIEVYFQYIKFCNSVGFGYAISGIIGQMLQMYGDKPKMWEMASKWESEEQNNLENARNFLLKGIHRHPDSESLYVELLRIEILLYVKFETEEEKEKQIKRMEVVLKNGMKSITDTSFLFKALELCLQFNTDEELINLIKKEIWTRNNEKEVWAYIALKELEDCHWEEIQEFVNEERDLPNKLEHYISTFEEALHKFSDKDLCTKYIHGLLGLDNSLCAGQQKVEIVKKAWIFGHENGLLTDDMYRFGIQMLKLEDKLSSEDLLEILETAAKSNPSYKYVWEEYILLSKADEKQMLSVINRASKSLSTDDVVQLWSVIVDNVDSADSLKNIYKKLQNCESTCVMAIKPKLLQKMYDHGGIKEVRALYEEFIRTPPIQQDLHRIVIDIEMGQDKPNVKQIRKCYEYYVQYHGTDNIELWSEYMKFETEKGSAHLAPSVYRRAIGSLKKELVDKFIKEQTLNKIN